MVVTDMNAPRRLQNQYHFICFAVKRRLKLAF
ncbi:hypothetical protein COLO4_10421 [Corchorus olitorius]|uniref:Uncharacterized protein n=1 Tax=Corchorus olitorius TaxID=93759 RepID=A0A1R3K8Q4_9ROSI|nr:hypothetical protein COLO4_10421 [Corchorus olitorius]